MDRQCDPDDTSAFANPAELASIHLVLREVCTRQGKFSSVFAGIDQLETLAQYEDRKRYWRCVKRALMVASEREIYRHIHDLVSDDNVNFNNVS
jgi:hypothetical protein